MRPEQTLDVRVWGKFACFTRTAIKVERVIYSVMTHSAARGVLVAIGLTVMMTILAAGWRRIRGRVLGQSLRPVGP